MCRHLVLTASVWMLEQSVRRERVQINLYLLLTPRTSYGSWSLIRLLIRNWEERVRNVLEALALEGDFTSLRLNESLNYRERFGSDEPEEEWEC